MGTRNLTCVVKNGEFRIAQYCQWDGYPSGVGTKVQDFIIRRLQTPEGLKAFNEQVLKTKQISTEAIRAKWKSVGADDSGWVNMEVSKKFQNNWPHLDRDFGPKVLDMVFKDGDVELSMEQEFAGASLFCEWCYVIDLDNNTLEVYRGFNKEKLDKSERFFCMPTDHEEYKQVRLYKSIPLSEVTEECMSKIDEQLAQENEDDE